MSFTLLTKLFFLFLWNVCFQSTFALASVLPLPTLLLGSTNGQVLYSNMKFGFNNQYIRLRIDLTHPNAWIFDSSHYNICESLSITPTSTSSFQSTLITSLVNSQSPTQTTSSASTSQSVFSSCINYPGGLDKSNSSSFNYVSQYYNSTDESYNDYSYTFQSFMALNSVAYNGKLATDIINFPYIIPTSNNYDNNGDDDDDNDEEEKDDDDYNNNDSDNRNFSADTSSEDANQVFSVSINNQKNNSYSSNDFLFLFSNYSTVRTAGLGLSAPYSNQFSFKDNQLLNNSPDPYFINYLKSSNLINSSSFSLLYNSFESMTTDENNHDQNNNNSLTFNSNDTFITKYNKRRSLFNSTNSGLLILGGYNKNLFMGDLISFNFIPYIGCLYNTDNNEYNDNDQNYLADSNLPILPLTGMSVTNDDNTSFWISNENFLSPVVLDSRVLYNYLPIELIIQLAIQLDAYYVLDSSNNYEWLMKCSVGDINATVDFIFGNLTIKIPIYELIEPAYDSSSNSILTFSSTNQQACSLKFRPSYESGYSILGVPFLKYIYLVVDQENRQLAMAQSKSNIDFLISNLDYESNINQMVTINSTSNQILIPSAKNNNITAYDSSLSSTADFYNQLTLTVQNVTSPGAVSVRYGDEVVSIISGKIFTQGENPSSDPNPLTTANTSETSSNLAINHTYNKYNNIVLYMIISSLSLFISFIL
ncbi:putative aspartic endopeptidase [Ascoidea rubescens DSM 1968]|uniref:Acid protease n=1 Tax=Ascoidea rubescens DSM 1968 TaxID=1344418 RepID=A0A1D2VJ08_9ASCO|nr:acid protease [Ascoidea rubescens DSM 1968]ODV61616.1 acid protease [Ascoidea rubescens DSM 1968]